MEIESETREGTPNESYIQDNVRYVTADYGLGSAGTQVTVYAAGRSTADIPSKIISWNPDLKEQKAFALSRWCLAIDGQTGYYSNQGA